VEDSTGNPTGCKQSSPQDDDGKIVDGGKGQPLFQVVLSKGQHPRNNNREGGKVGQSQPEVQFREKFGTEDIKNDSQNTEDPALTTATAWSKALTGVGATMAVGSHSWRGMRAALSRS